MADKKPAAAAAAAPATPAADKPKLPLLPILGAALGSAVLVGAVMFFMMPDPAPAPANADADADETAIQAAEARYVEIQEPLVVNLTGGGARFLQVEVQLATRSEEGQKAIETHLPAIRSALLILLRQTTAEDLAKPDIMVSLQAQAQAEANRVIAAETQKQDSVSALLFTSFVTQ